MDGKYATRQELKLPDQPLIEYWDSEVLCCPECGLYPVKRNTPLRVTYFHRFQQYLCPNGHKHWRKISIRFNPYPSEHIDDWE